MSEFKIGEDVIGQNFIVDVEYNGREAIVVSSAIFDVFELPDGSIESCWACEITWECGLTEWQKISHLRRRKPPTEYKGEQLIATLIRETLDKAPQRAGVPA